MMLFFAIYWQPQKHSIDEIMSSALAHLKEVHPGYAYEIKSQVMQPYRSSGRGNFFTVDEYCIMLQLEKRQL